MSWEIEYHTGKMNQDKQTVAILNAFINGGFTVPEVTSEQAAELLRLAECGIEYHAKKIEEAHKVEIEKAWKDSPEYPMAFEAWKAKYEAQQVVA